MRRSSSVPLADGRVERAQVNPFWSELVQSDSRLEGSRPTVLPPVPNDDDLGVETNHGTPSSMGAVPLSDARPDQETPRTQPLNLRTQGLASETPNESVHPSVQQSQGPVKPNRSRSPSRPETGVSNPAVFRTPSSWVSKEKQSESNQKSRVQLQSARMSDVQSEPSRRVQKSAEVLQREHRSPQPHASVSSVPSKNSEASEVSLEREVERRMFEMLKESTRSCSIR